MAHADQRARGHAVCRGYTRAMSSIAGLSLTAVRRQFDRRAVAPAASDFLHREIERRMLERLALVRAVPKRVLEVGCGAGSGLAALAQHYPGASRTGVDLSPANLARAAVRFAPPSQNPTARAAVPWWRRWTAEAVPEPARDARDESERAAPDLVLADTQCLPFAGSQFDLLWSNLMLHWSPDPGRVFAEWSRVLRAEGLLMFSAYGVDSLRELRANGWLTQRFPDLHDLGDALVRTGFAAPVMDMEQLQLCWSDARRALADLRALGGDAREDRRPGLRGRATERAILGALERARDREGQISVTVEIVYGHAWCSPASKLPPGAAPVQWRARAP